MQFVGHDTTKRPMLIITNERAICWLLNKRAWGSMEEGNGIKHVNEGPMMMFITLRNILASFVNDYENRFSDFQNHNKRSCYLWSSANYVPQKFQMSSILKAHVYVEGTT